MKPRKNDIVIFDDEQGRIHQVSKGFAYVDVGNGHTFRPAQIAHLKQDKRGLPQRVWRY